MDITLTALEARVIGALIEKEITTPEQYPLSLNALANACNQKSNREPVMELVEAQVQDTLDGLVKKHMVSEKTAFGSRVTKYRHRFCNTEFGSLTFSPQELGILCVMLLRGRADAGGIAHPHQPPVPFRRRPGGRSHARAADAARRRALRRQIAAGAGKAGVPLHAAFQ